ncbi:hypothetical protein MPTK1_6g04530 [Marchantia polymorpha subsp. ruderalis]|uniref:Uncharacterized protein n=2 Tax=Marchantia polymorpha TaxID=3197 RepID=A0AAF6BNH2_MARPO|nr:hypothetical protein MARPO_0034s0063 [Marchantia polymorpha]BBN13556.1 hypothetical protein Mp_6g04530 [Marchantia polymorpha subsp. ruderalis]|eukprot:PTQ41476.1 hypothetical protein MARPO_0034s0063 [Marchantia polymorpha]
MPKSVQQLSKSCDAGESLETAHHSTIECTLFVEVFEVQCGGVHVKQVSSCSTFCVYSRANLVKAVSMASCTPKVFVKVCLSSILEIFFCIQQ